MLYLALAVACSLAVAMIFKVSDRRGLDRMVLLTANYAVALALAGAFLAAGAAERRLVLGPGLLGLGIGTGALFMLGFVVFSAAVVAAGMSLAAGVMRLAVVLPFLASWLVWEEVPTGAQAAGLVVAGAAFFLLARRERPVAASAGATDVRAFGLLALLFLVGGMADVAMKTFDEEFAASSSRALFLVVVFGVASGIGVVAVASRGIRQGTWPRGDALRWGVLLGLVNYGSVEFFLQAVAQLPGPFVFPANNIAIVIGAALLGVGVWGERLSPVNRVGLVLAVLALVLLGL